MGPYVGAAVASIAANEVVAAVDANVIRVLARLRCLDMDSSSEVAKVLHTRLATQLVDPARPGDFNQVRCPLRPC